ncbi:MAG: DPP IV N-terminal domain-containing protein, partial [Gemmatimonadales bacterium]
MSPARLLVATATLTVTLAAALPAQQPGADSSMLTLDRIFNSAEFQPEQLGEVRWLPDRPAYLKLEADSGSSPGGAPSLVRYDAAAGKREVLVPAARMVQPGDSAPLPVEDYDLSPDGKRLLIFTNSRKVWRQNTRGDFYALDLGTWKLTKLGGPQAKPSTLMFGKFSPDGGRVAYVRENNLYVENLGDGRITQLTKDGSRTIINGTFDWVYEEELSLRDGFRWSPDGRRIAYWQLDASGVRDFLLINDTDSLYSFTIPVQYPKAGTTNSAGRVGVVSADGGPTVWLKVPGDPRNNYIARLEWAASPDELVLQHLNRLQNTDDVMLADAATGNVRTVLTEHDSAWVDVVDDLRWVDRGKSFTWISERDGWRHLYVVSRDGKKQ